MIKKKDILLIITYTEFRNVVYLIPSQINK